MLDPHTNYPSNSDYVQKPVQEANNVDSIDHDDNDGDEDHDGGIQADDEDNDQIETERATNPKEKRDTELQRILQSKQNGSKSGRNQKASNSSSGIGKASGKRKMNYQQH